MIVSNELSSPSSSIMSSDINKLGLEILILHLILDKSSLNSYPTPLCMPIFANHSDANHPDLVRPWLI